MAGGCGHHSRAARDAPRTSQAPRPGPAPVESLHLADPTPHTDASPARLPLNLATAARGFSFAGTLVPAPTPAPLPLRSQASLAPLASPRLLRVASPACSGLTWGQNNPEPNAVAPAGREAVAAVR